VAGEALEQTFPEALISPADNPPRSEAHRVWPVLRQNGELRRRGCDRARLAGRPHPDPLLTVSEWADRYRVLSQRASSEPGRWRTARTPYLKEIMDCLSSSSPVQRVVFMKGSQTGGTEAGNNFIGYVIHEAPGPMMAVAPTVELAKRNSKQRLDPLIEESEVLRERVKERRSRDSGNTVLSKEFRGGVLILTGANSAVGLRSMPARYLFLDEVDGYPGDVEGEGDPILLAERRSATFQRRKILLVSTPKTKGLSRIEREYEQSDQRRYFVPCPHCHERQTLELANLCWPEGRPREAEYACAHCGGLIGERHKTWMLERGEWRPTAPGDGRTAGFHLSSLYSPVGWFSWADAAEMYEQAQNTPDLMKGLVNTVLGLPFEEEAEAPDWQRLYERRESYRIGVVPEPGLFLTAGVDVQKDRIEVEVVAGAKKEQWEKLDGDSNSTCSRDALDRDHSMPCRRLIGSEQPDHLAADIVSGPELEHIVAEVGVNTINPEGRRRKRLREHWSVRG
jgi:phage terminase large subunit GpA-like protein